MNPVLDTLRFHRGENRAITAKELTRYTGKDDRAIRIEIRGLIAQGIPVASNLRPPYGYYIASTIQEAKDYMQQLRNRLIEDARRHRDFRLAARSILHSEQLKLI